MQQQGSLSWLIAFALIYLTFFLDNVLLTVLVPIIPDWVRGSSLAEWGAHGAAHGAPLARVLNATVHQTQTGVGGSQALVGLVLSAKAAAQLAVAGPAAGLVCRRGPAVPLRLGTALLLLAAFVFAWCSMSESGWTACVAAGVGRTVQGAGAALCGVSGLTLAARAAPAASRARAIAALLGAVALGVLVGYPFGGATYAFWSPQTPFLIIAAAILATLTVIVERRQWHWRRAERAGGGTHGPLRRVRGRSLTHYLRHGSAGALSTALDHAALPSTVCMLQKWVSGMVFVPDSAAYALSASTLEGVARAVGAESLALAGQLAVAIAALVLPHATSVGGLCGPHVVLGLGLGATDAALVPALLARARLAPHRAALFHAAASAAYALGPILGGLVSWSFGFETMMRALGVLNFLYAAFLYRALKANPLSKQWGADISDDDDDEEEQPSEVAELAPLNHHHYKTTITK